MTNHPSTLATEITALAVQVFGDTQMAHQWLNRPARALDGAKPADMLSDLEGSEAVRNLLWRIEYCVYC